MTARPPPLLVAVGPHTRPPTADELARNEQAIADWQRDRAGPARGVPAVSTAAPSRPERTRVVCALYGVPAPVTDEILARAMSVRQVVALLQAATGDAKIIPPAGITAVRLALVAVDNATASKSASNAQTRAAEIGLLCIRHGLSRTYVAQALAHTTLPVAVLAELIAARTDAAGRIQPAAQACLMRDLTLAEARKQ